MSGLPTITVGYRWVTSRPGEAAYAAFAALPGLLYAAQSPRMRLGFDPAAECLVSCNTLLRGDAPVGRFALYENHQLRYQNAPVACVGSYECVNDPTVAYALLARAKNLALRLGHTYLIGPMEGSTWATYRFNLDSQAPSLVTPTHHAYYPDQWRAAGFAPIAHYVSNLDRTPAYDAARLQKFRRVFREKGATLRRLTAENLEGQLGRIGAFCNAAFADNFLFTPQTPVAFAAQYRAVAPLLDQGVSWTVEDHNGQLQALFFGIPDLACITERRLIIKTIATRPGSPFRGMASYLVVEAYAYALAHGYTSLLHAYMHTGNASINSSGKYTVQEHQRHVLLGGAL